MGQYAQALLSKSPFNKPETDKCRYPEHDTGSCEASGSGGRILH